MSETRVDMHLDGSSNIIDSQINSFFMSLIYGIKDATVYIASSLAWIISTAVMIAKYIAQTAIVLSYALLTLILFLPVVLANTLMSLSLIGKPADSPAEEDKLINYKITETLYYISSKLYANKFNQVIDIFRRTPNLLDEFFNTIWPINVEDNTGNSTTATSNDFLDNLIEKHMRSISIWSLKTIILYFAKHDKYSISDLTSQFIQTLFRPIPEGTFSVIISLVLRLIQVPLFIVALPLNVIKSLYQALLFRTIPLTAAEILKAVYILENVYYALNDLIYSPISIYNLTIPSRQDLPDNDLSTPQTLAEEAIQSEQGQTIAIRAISQVADGLRPSLTSTVSVGNTPVLEFKSTPTRKGQNVQLTNLSNVDLGTGVPSLVEVISEHDETNNESCKRQYSSASVFFDKKEVSRAFALREKTSDRDVLLFAMATNTPDATIETKFGLNLTENRLRFFLTVDASKRDGHNALDTIFPERAQCYELITGNDNLRLTDGHS